VTDKHLAYYRCSVINCNHARFEIVTVPLLKIQVFWEVMLHHWVSGSDHFRGF